MSDRDIPGTIGDLMREIKTAQEEIVRADAERVRKLEQKADKAELTRLTDELASKCTKLQTAVESLSRKIGRPGGGGPGDFTFEADQKAARGLLELKNQLRVPKADIEREYRPTPDELTEAELAVKAMKHLLKTSSIDTLPLLERKALTSFQLGASGFILPPEWSSRILSCLENKTDVAALMSNISISGPSLKMFADNALLDEAKWACDVDCWSAQRVKDLAAGLSELEFKPESLRYIICSSRDLIEDAAVDVEAWMIQKVNRAFVNTVSTAVMTGDGIGKPQGILHPAAGIPICDTGANTPAGQLTWQDLIMLKWQVPMQFQGGGRYLMNQHTFALILTMSDALGRPIMISMPTDNGQFLINGSPIQIVTQMPDVVPGSAPVAYGNWPVAYTVVNRKAVTMQQDPYSAGFCILWKFEARIGGGILCANAARLLRIK